MPEVCVNRPYGTGVPTRPLKLSRAHANIAAGTTFNPVGARTMSGTFKTAAIGFGSGMVGAAVMLAVAGAAAPVPETVEARGFVLRDYGGRQRFSLSAADDTRFVMTEDSLDLVELVMEFEVTIPDDEAERITSVTDAIRFIIRHDGKAA
jgi:hypothetical protein